MGQFLQMLGQQGMQQGGTPQFGALSSSLGNINAPQGNVGQASGSMAPQVQQPSPWTPKIGGR